MNTAKTAARVLGFTESMGPGQRQRSLVVLLGAQLGDGAAAQREVHLGQRGGRGHGRAALERRAAAAAWKGGLEGMLHPTCSSQPPALAAPAAAGLAAAAAATLAAGAAGRAHPRLDGQRVVAEAEALQRRLRAAAEPGSGGARGAGPHAWAARSGGLNSTGKRTNRCRASQPTRRGGCAHHELERVGDVVKDGEEAAAHKRGHAAAGQLPEPSHAEVVVGGVQRVLKQGQGRRPTS